MRDVVPRLSCSLSLTFSEDMLLPSVGIEPRFPRGGSIRCFRSISFRSTCKFHRVIRDSAPTRARARTRFIEYRTAAEDEGHRKFLTRARNGQTIYIDIDMCPRRS